MEIRGSQRRESLEEAGYRIFGNPIHDDVVLEDIETGHRELWQKNDDFAGYVVVIDGVGYEFVRSARMGDQWWAGGKLLAEVG